MQTTLTDTLSQFRDALAAYDLNPPEIIADGKIHRFDATDGKHGNKSAWYVLHDDGLPAGSFGNWKTSETQTWSSKTTANQSPIERQQHQERLQQFKALIEAAKLAQQTEAAEQCNRLWNNATEASEDNPYLERKGIKPYGVREFKDSQTLIIPIRDEAAHITSLQFIDKDGGKRFKGGGRIEGAYYGFGGEPIDTLLICEGFATGASLHLATGYPVAVAFNAGNLEAVAKILRGKLPAMRLILCADNDRFTSTGNIGINKASKAAQAVSGLLAVPQFNSDTNEPTDFNDLHQIEGLAAVKAAIDGAIHAANKKEKPEPLPEMPSVLPFDYDYLPDALRGYVHDISERMQCPPDFAAVTVLVMMATIIGRKVTMRPMKKDDWTVTCNLWGAVVGSSGVMKSPTMGAAIKPLKKMQKAASDEFNKDALEFNSQQEIATLQRGVNKNKARAALKKGTAAHEARDLLKVGGLDDLQPMKRFITNNSSYQALSEVLMENPNGLLLEADEIIGWLKSLDSDGQQEARAFYLTAADGDKSYTFDRIIRGKGLHIPAVCLSIIGGIQPGVLAEYVRQAVSGGAGADGLLQRFALMVYPDISPKWKEVDRYPDKEARHTVDDLCARMEFINPERIGAEVDLYGDIPFLRFDDNAQKVFSEWRFALEHKLRSADEHPALVSHFSKYRKLIPSLALINHLCDSPEGGSVTEQALVRSIAFSEYLESHARRIYSFGTRPDVDAAKTLLHHIKKGKLSSPFNLRELYRHGWTGLETPLKAQSAVSVLLEYNQLIEKVIETGGRNTTEYRLNIGA